MSRMKRPMADKPTAGQPPPQPGTTAPGGVKGPVGAGDEPDAKMPHERDESAGSAADPSPGQAQEAYEDARRGLPDTSKSEAMDATYHQLRKKGR